MSLSDIQRAADHLLGGLPVSAVTEMKDGWFNRTFHLVLDGGKLHRVLKVGPPETAEVMRYEEGILKAEVGAMRLVASNPHIPVPGNLAEDFSRSVLPFDYYFMDFFDGPTWQSRRATLGEAENNRLASELGFITARINGFTGDSFGYFSGNQNCENWFEAFYVMCDNLFLDAERYRVGLDIGRRVLLDKLTEYRQIFAEVEVPQLVHWDLWQGNVFLSATGEPHITGVIDFERALWGDPLMEVALVSPAGARHFLAGYGQDLFASREARLRRVFYNIYLDLVMIIEDGPRQYDNKTSVLQAIARLPRDLAMLMAGDFQA
ncbi:MAG: phosphotransferase family protein [Pseudomonadota bacterium]